MNCKIIGRSWCTHHMYNQMNSVDKHSMPLAHTGCYHKLYAALAVNLYGSELGHSATGLIRNSKTANVFVSS